MIASLREERLRDAPSAITALDLRAGVDFEGYGVQFRVQNLLDARGLLNLGSDNMATIIGPRSIALALSADF